MRALASIAFAFIVCGVINFGQAEDLVVPETILLWPDGAPGAVGEEPEDQPSITVYQPSVRSQTKSAIIICPGGGYRGLAMGHEGQEIAGWVTSLKMTAFVLKYRLAPRYGHPAPMQDVQRAFRHVRQNADQYGINPDKLGVMGFSAGGHLASTALTHFDMGNSEAESETDQQSCRPSFGILCYPVISMEEGVTHGGSRKNLLGDNPSEELVTLMSNDKQVTKETPPTFLFHTYEDTAVLPINSILFYKGMIENGVTGELHIFQAGRHGVGLGKNIPATGAWSQNAENWLRSSGWME